MSIVRSLRTRTAFVAVVVVLLGALALAGCLGPAVGNERVAAYDVTAIIRPDRTVQVREVLDWDFAGQSRHGIYRTIPFSGGMPTDITVSSPTAPDEVQVTELSTRTEVRVGDPDLTVSGRHRYVLTYVLPATIEDDRFALNAVGTELLVGSEHVTVTILGAELDEPRCFTGGYGSRSTCTVEEVDGGYRTEVDGLGAHEGVTIDGDVVAVDGDAQVPDLPPFVDRDGSARVVWAAVVVALGALAALATYVVCLRLGRNEVAGGGATEAAFAPDGDFGFHPPEPDTPPPGTRLVADTAMGDLAGLDFVPPHGVEPWEASVVTREKIDNRTIGAWFASLAAHDVVTFHRGEHGSVRLLPGPRAAEADATVSPILNRAFQGRESILLGSYDPRFAEAWSDAGRAIDAWTIGSGVFRRRPPRYSGASGSTGSALVWLIPVVVFLGAGGTTLVAGLRTGFAAVVAAVVGSSVAALLAYLPLTRGLSAAGSAIALRCESFRRFLHDSEAQHVEWAWQNGLLREYSAWAVALGEADAWNRALSASSVPPVEADSGRDILVPVLYAPSFSSTTTAPQSASTGGGSSFSGGFSGGGFSGGGGGGGGGGSW